MDLSAWARGRGRGGARSGAGRGAGPGEGGGGAVRRPLSPAAPQGFPEISTLPWFTLFAPLLCLLIIRAARDLVDDIVSGGRARTGPGPYLGARAGRGGAVPLTRPLSAQGRHRSDRIVNNRPCQILVGKR